MNASEMAVLRAVVSKAFGGISMIIDCPDCDGEMTYDAESLSDNEVRDFIDELDRVGRKAKP